MTNEIDASKMNLADLRDFALVLSALADAGEDAIIPANLIPTYSVVPGQPITMTVDYVVPVAERALSNSEHLKELADKNRPEDFPADPLPLAFPLGIPLAPAPTSYPGMNNPVADPLPVGSFVDNAPDRPEPASPPGSASAMAAARPANWTEDEDDKAIAAYVVAIRAGTTITDATGVAATAVGRPFNGTQFRLRNKLADRVSAALAAKPEILEPPVSQQAAGTEAGEDTSSEGQADRSPATPLAAPDDALGAHLSRLPRKDGWSLEADQELARLATESGWGMQDIAVEFGMDAGAVKTRWDALTGLHRDERTNKMVRTYASADVLNRLRQLLAA